MKTKRILTLGLSLLLCLSLLSVSALAEELPAEPVEEEIADVPVDVSEPATAPEEPVRTQPEEEPPTPENTPAEEPLPAAPDGEAPSVCGECIYINPLYADVVSESELYSPELTESTLEHALDSASDYYTSSAAAAAYIRSCLKTRQATVTVEYRSATFSDDVMRELWAEALEHTGAATEGDYLMWQYAGWKGQYGGSEDGEYYYLTLMYNMTYFTTAAQEAAVDTAVESVLTELALNGRNDYLKLRAIYDYICENVVYDYVHLSDETYMLQYTAYAALVEGTAVCQGYANLFYRLALESGVDARIVVGKGNEGNHAWNIAELDELYYDLDSTWDATRAADGAPYAYFLLCDASFDDHTREADYATEEFYAAYPMGAADYVYVDPCAGGHDWDAGSVTTPASKTAPGVMTFVCAGCGEKRTETIPMLPIALSFDAGEGVCATSEKNVYFGALYGELPTPTRAGYGFDGWYTAADGGDRITAADTVALTDDGVLYAHWSLAVFAVTGEPADCDGVPGQTATFTVTATGEGLTYRWQYSANGSNWSNASGESAATASYSVEVKSYRIGYRYRCVVTDGGGHSLTSQEAELKLKPCAATITEQPASYAGAPQDDAAFTVTAAGEGLTYRWQCSTNGGTSWKPTSLTGCATDTLSVKLYAYRNGWMYRCVVSDAEGLTVTTEPVTLSLKTSEIEIAAQPSDYTGTLNELTSFTVAATAENLTYQWYVSMDGGATWQKSYNSGYRSETLQVRLYEYRDGYQYKCELTSGEATTAETEPATLRKIAKTVRITSQPSDANGLADTDVTFRVGATGNGLSYQWQYSTDGGASWASSSGTGNDGPALTVTAKAYRHGQLYRCRVTDESGSGEYSAAATLRVGAGPTITGQAANYTGAVGGTASYVVAATGDGLSYQWYYSNTGGATWSKTSATGAQTAELSVEIKSYRFGYLYKCAVTDAQGITVWSNAVSLLEG